MGFQEERDRVFHPDYGYGTVGGTLPQESTVRPSYSQPRPLDHADDERNVRGPGFDYERLLPPGSRPRGRASAH